MKEAMSSGGPVVAPGVERPRRRSAAHCSVCTIRIWFKPVHMQEPVGVPEPRLSWVLCKSCYQLLLAEMSRSPVLSPLRLRIAMGLVAAERWPHAYPTRIREYVSDRRWILFIVGFFLFAMLFHLALIVAVATLH